MAAVHPPPVARHPSPFRYPKQRLSQSQVAPQASTSQHHHHTPAVSPSDPFYGHEETAKICSRYVTHVFTCPDVPVLQPATSSSATSASTTGASSSAAPPPPISQAHPPALANFIAYALHRTRLHPSVTFTALALLHRLKTRFPAARGSSGHRLFLSAFMIASKVVCDDTYSNKSWAVVGQGMFALREINQMEREMCSYLEWYLNVDPEELGVFESAVRSVFGKVGPYEVGVTSRFVISMCGHAGGGVEKELVKEKEQQLPTPTDVGMTKMPFTTVPVTLSSSSSTSSSTVTSPVAHHASTTKPHLHTIITSSASTPAYSKSSRYSSSYPQQYAQAIQQYTQPYPQQQQQLHTRPSAPGLTQPSKSYPSPVSDKTSSTTSSPETLDPVIPPPMSPIERESGYAHVSMSMPVPGVYSYVHPHPNSNSTSTNTTTTTAHSSSTMIPTETSPTTASDGSSPGPATPPSAGVEKGVVYAYAPPVQSGVGVQHQNVNANPQVQAYQQQYSQAYVQQQQGRGERERSYVNSSSSGSSKGYNAYPQQHPHTQHSQQYVHAHQQRASIPGPGASSTSLSYYQGAVTGAVAAEGKVRALSLGSSGTVPASTSIVAASGRTQTYPQPGGMRSGNGNGSGEDMEFGVDAYDDGFDERELGDDENDNDNDEEDEERERERAYTRHSNSSSATKGQIRSSYAHHSTSTSITPAYQPRPRDPVNPRDFTSRESHFTHSSQSTRDRERERERERDRDRESNASIIAAARDREARERERKKAHMAGCAISRTVTVACGW